MSAFMMLWTAGSSTGTSVPWVWALLRLPRFIGARSTQTITTIGLDIAKSVFQVHGVDAGGQAVIRRQLEGVAMCWRSSKSRRHVWSGSKPAARRTTGRANCRH